MIYYEKDKLGVSPTLNQFQIRMPTYNISWHSLIFILFILFEFIVETCKIVFANNTKLRDII